MPMMGRATIAKRTIMKPRMIMIEAVRSKSEKKIAVSRARKPVPVRSQARWPLMLA